MNDEIEKTLTLRGDVECILLECHRDRPGIFASSVTRELLAGLAGQMARGLGPLISGRYVTSRYAREKVEKDERDAAVFRAFTGGNHAELMKRFVLSRRLVYSILAQKRKG